MTISQDILLAVKKALRITTIDFDTEIIELIQAAVKDLGIAGVSNDIDDPLVLTAIKTYVRMHFGQPDDYDKLKASYDEQKAQMQVSTGYTNWGDEDGQI